MRDVDEHREKLFLILPLIVVHIFHPFSCIYVYDDDGDGDAREYVIVS
jgi:hypothetical protein